MADANAPENREIRRRPAAFVECPRCHKRVTLTQETEEWTQRRDGTWEHADYGPPVGDCCGLAFIDSPWDGIQAFVIDAERTEVQG